MNAGQLTNALIALATLVTAITGLVAVFRRVGTTVTQLNGKVDAGNQKLDNVEQLVNGNHTIAIARIDQLSKTLSNAGVPIPDKPNVEAGKDNAV